MIVIPAVDLLEGKVVRLRKGNFADKTVYAGSAELYVERWQKSGAARIHVVDLEGALKGKISEWETLKRIIKAAKVPVEFGGGVRSLSDVEQILSVGFQYAILGTAVLEDHQFVKEAIKKFPGRVLISLDACGGRLKTEGWTKDGALNIIDFARQISDWGIREIIYTNIEKDGVLTGPDIEGLKSLLSSTRLSVILSGGISSIDDIRSLMSISEPRFVGVICGRALYEGKLKLEDVRKLLSGKEDNKVARD